MLLSMILSEPNMMAYPLATTRETMTPMTSHEPDPAYTPDTDTAQLFARYKRTLETERTLKPKVREAAEHAIRAGASNQELAALTGMTPEYFRKLATAIGVDNRRRAPTVGREVEAQKAAAEQ